MEPADLGTGPVLTVRRSSPVAPEKVWRAWTEGRALAQWFGPDASFSIPVAEADVRVGPGCALRSTPSRPATICEAMKRYGLAAGSPRRFSRRVAGSPAPPSTRTMAPR